MTDEIVTFEIFNNFRYAFAIIKLLHEQEIYPICNFDEKKIYFCIKFNELTAKQQYQLSNLIMKLDVENVNIIEKDNQLKK